VAGIVVRGVLLWQLWLSRVTFGSSAAAKPFRSGFMLRCGDIDIVVVFCGGRYYSFCSAFNGIGNMILVTFHYSSLFNGGSWRCVARRGRSRR